MAYAGEAVPNENRTARMARILSLLMLLLCLSSPCLAADPPAPATPFIQGEVRWLWGLSQFEGSPTTAASIGKPATLLNENQNGVKVEAIILIKEISNGMAVMNLKLKLTPTGQAATITDVTAVAKLGQSFHVEVKPDETRNLFLDFTILKAAPKDE